MTKTGCCFCVASAVLCLLLCWHVVVPTDIQLRKKWYFSQANRQAYEIPEAEPGNINDLFDLALNNTKRLFVERTLEPLPIGEILVCKECFVAGVTTARRTGDVTLGIDKEDILFDANFGFDLMRGKCKCSQKIGFIKFRWDLQFIIRNIDVFTKLRIELYPKINPKVEELKVIKSGKLDIYWEGNEFLSSVIETFFDIFRHKIAWIVKLFLTSLIKRVVNEKKDILIADLNDL